MAIACALSMNYDYLTVLVELCYKIFSAREAQFGDSVDDEEP
jgi:hypothetical protein